MARRGTEVLLAQPFTLLLVHHSHTDVGYTEAQPRIERWHVDFLRQALAILAERPDFRWTCETLWAVERFLAEATPDGGGGLRRARPRAAHRPVGLLPELQRADRRAGAARGHRAGGPRGGGVGRGRAGCAMTADVNGFGWGFAEALLDAGVENLFTCVHTHHGMYPLGRTPVPFRWEAPDGRQVLVWSGEHYHLGNELGLVPGANSSYLIKDECDAATIFGDHRKVAATPHPALRRGAAARGATPTTSRRSWRRASGRTTRRRTSPCSTRSSGGTRRTRRPRASRSAWPCWRTSSTGSAGVASSTVHRGDWPDWWSDGPASRPASVRLFRRTQRELARLDALGAVDADGDDRAAIETDLALFAEHTCSHSDSMSQPWHELVLTIDALNEGHLARACAAVGVRREGANARQGGAPLRPGLSLRYRVSNPHAETVTDVARLGVGHHEFEELGLGAGFVVRDGDTGQEQPCQLAHVPRGGEILVPVSLAPGAVRELEIVAATNGRRAPGDRTGGGELATDHVRVSWRAPGGIDHLVDAATGRDLLRPGAPHAPFQPIHDVTPLADVSDVCGVRGRMGLNRKGADAILSAGELEDAVRVVDGEVLRAATLAYDLAGTRFCELELTAHTATPRLDVALRLHKESLWAPENLYAALPFTAGDRAATWLDKAGAILRPRLDQIPGTLTDFYAVQAGWASVADDFGVVVLMPDQHLLQLGPLAHGERLLAGDPRLAHDPAHPYGWLMTNYWETNFTADLGGFHEFRYTVLWGTDLADPVGALARGRAALLGLETVRLAKDVR